MRICEHAAADPDGGPTSTENRRHDYSRTTAADDCVAAERVLPSSSATSPPTFDGKRLAGTADSGTGGHLQPVASHAQQQPLCGIGAADRDGIPQEAAAAARTVRAVPYAADTAARRPSAEP